jgi:hypothetical protein
MAETVQVDLFGNPVPQVRGPGRPAHVATAETRAFVNMLFVCGHDVMAVAKALGLSRTAFYEHYRAEIAERQLAALKFKGHQMIRLNRLAQDGNVGAEKALAGMIAGEQLKALGQKIERRSAPSMPTPKGKKEQQREAAGAVGGHFAPREAPPSLIN